MCAACLRYEILLYAHLLVLHSTEHIYHINNMFYVYVLPYLSERLPLLTAPCLIKLHKYVFCAFDFYWIFRYEIY